MAFSNEILRTFPKPDVSASVRGMTYVPGDEKEDPQRTSGVPNVETESWLTGLTPAFLRGGV